MKTILLASLFACLLLPIAAEAQSYYKWRDDQGTVHFTAEPPVDRDYEIVDTRGNVVGRSAPTAPVESGPDEQPAVMPREAEPDPEVVARRCRQARENLLALNANRRILMEREDGTEVMLTEEQRQEQIQRNQDVIDELCAEDQGG